jgi:iron complex transport system substrate-binding protein
MIRRTHHRRTGRLFAALAALALLTAGCADSDDAGGPEGQAGSPSAAVTFPVTVGDVTVEKRPEKIVSLSPTLTEMLFAIGAGGQVAAVDDNSNYPPDAPKTDLSGFQPNAEAVAAKEPDLVVLTTDTNKIVSQLEALKIPVYVGEAAVVLDDTYRELTELGALTGHPAEAAEVVSTMKSDIDAAVKSVPQRAQRPTYYHELGPELYSATSKTFIGSLYAMAGLDNIADPADADGSKQGYPQLSEEFVVKADPDYVFLADTKCCAQSPATVKARDGWAGITAVKQDRIVALDDDIASRWGPRIVDLLRTVVAATKAGQ